MRGRAYEISDGGTCMRKCTRVSLSLCVCVCLFFVCFICLCVCVQICGLIRQALGARVKSLSTIKWEDFLSEENRKALEALNLSGACGCR
jgi:hypothetical protein